MHPIKCSWQHNFILSEKLRTKPDQKGLQHGVGVRYTAEAITKKPGGTHQKQEYFSCYYYHPAVRTAANVNIYTARAMWFGS